MSDPRKTWNLLFLCTGNSARSIIAEAIVNNTDIPAGYRLRAFSAGSRPAGRVNPLALELLERLGYETRDLRSKSWEEFAAPGAPAMDFVFTVCDRAARESCPVWPGHPATAHWGLPDPAAVEGSEAEKRLAFADTHDLLARRIGRLAALPLNSPDRAELCRCLSEIGASAGDGVAADRGARSGRPRA